MSWRRRRQVVDETAVPPPRRPQLWPWAVLLLLLVAGIVAAAILLTRDDVPRVPDVVGLSTPAAVAELGRHGYSADVETTTRPSSQPGTVISQTPGADTKLDRGGRVIVVATRGTVNVGVPDVLGLPVAQAFTRLQAVGLKGKTRAVASERPKDTVLSQSPAAEGRAPKGSTVLMTIAKGPGGGAGTVTVPRVVGLTQAQATAKLQGLGFRPRISRTASTKPAGLVITQVPPQGAKAASGSVVELVVSDGPATTTNATTTTTTPAPAGVRVPNVVGMGQLPALSRLEAAGFRADSYPAASNRPRGLVISQRPLAGTRAPKRFVVRINVSLGRGRRPLRVVPDLLGKSEANAKHLLAQVGLTARSVSQATESSAAGTVVVDQKPPAGNRRPAGSQVLIYLGSG
ncbi:MAG TPA: PASTA domain-containing protein [Gaiellaceae bacterium]|jgi:serine/threonine-protein kinase